MNKADLARGFEVVAPWTSKDMQNIVSKGALSCSVQTTAGKECVVGDSVDSFGHADSFVIGGKGEGNE